LIRIGKNQILPTVVVKVARGRVVGKLVEADSRGETAVSLPEQHKRIGVVADHKVREAEISCAALCATE
jgi:hypothetical protein